MLINLLETTLKVNPVTTNCPYSLGVKNLAENDGLFGSTKIQKSRRAVQGEPFNFTLRLRYSHCKTKSLAGEKACALDLLVRKKDALML